MALELWYPDAIKNPANTDGGSFTSTRWRGVLHTTETQGFTKGSRYYGDINWPHFTVIRRGYKNVEVYQHIGINRAARALRNPPGGVQTNRAGSIQIETVGYAAQSASFPWDLVQGLKNLMRWIEAERGIPPESGLTFRGNEASGVNGASRMSSNDWNWFSGWCGHQHVPENTHWDPGRIKIDDLLTIDWRSGVPLSHYTAMSRAVDHGDFSSTVRGDALVDRQVLAVVIYRRGYLSGYSRAPDGPWANGVASWAYESMGRAVSRGLMSADISGTTVVDRAVAAVVMRRLGLTNSYSVAGQGIWSADIPQWAFDSLGRAVTAGAFESNVNWADKVQRHELAQAFYELGLLPVSGAA